MFQTVNHTLQNMVQNGVALTMDIPDSQPKALIMIPNGADLMMNIPNHTCSLILVHLGTSHATPMDPHNANVSFQQLANAHTSHKRLT